MKKVLDLRNKDKASSPKPQRAREVINKNTRAIRWDAPSFYFNPRKRYLLFTIAGIITACGVLVFYYYDILTALFLIMTAVVIVLSSNKKPTVSKILINEVGVAIDENRYFYKDLKSFCISYNPGYNKELSLEFGKWYMPYVKLSIENKNPLAIRSIMIDYLPEKEHENSLIDIIIKRMGL